MSGAGYISSDAAQGAGVMARLGDLRAILGGEYEPLRAVWDEQATAKDRRLMLAMAGHAGSMASRLSSMAWCDLLPSTRVAIAGGLKRWAEWAERLK